MVCGPLCSAFVMIITLWGVVFLGIVGLLFHQNSVGLMEDLPKDSAKDSDYAGEMVQEYWAIRTARLKTKYADKALVTWYAAAAHAVTFLLAFGRFMMVRNRL